LHEYTSQDTDRLKRPPSEQEKVSAKDFEKVTGGSIAHSTTEPQPRSNEQRFFRFAGAHLKAASAVGRPGGKEVNGASHAVHITLGGGFWHCFGLEYAPAKAPQWQNCHYDFSPRSDHD
jgi:hypothetical protein